MNEDYTNQLCNGCHKKVEPMYGAGGSDAIHNVRCCLSATWQRKTMNRDANAALSILYIFTHESRRGARPEVFTHRYQQSIGDLIRAQ